MGFFLSLVSLFYKAHNYAKFNYASKTKACYQGRTEKGRDSRGICFLLNLNKNSKKGKGRDRRPPLCTPMRVTFVTNWNPFLLTKQLSCNNKCNTPTATAIFHVEIA